MIETGEEEEEKLGDNRQEYLKSTVSHVWESVKKKKWMVGQSSVNSSQSSRFFKNSPLLIRRFLLPLLFISRLWASAD